MGDEIHQQHQEDICNDDAKLRDVRNLNGKLRAISARLRPNSGLSGAVATMLDSSEAFAASM